ncbi:MAG TPA: enoyl-CoA hydratase family protein [Thermoplasmata archaeon]|nr:enoyl-CoA hydratase family protein [Thermoplasmata archaeon]
MAKEKKRGEGARLSPFDMPAKAKDEEEESRAPPSARRETQASLDSDPFRDLPDGLVYEEEPRVGVITLSRPQKLNALTFEMYRALRDIFAALRERRHLRAVLLTGEGRGFCSGGDVDDIIGELLKRDPEGLRNFTRLTCDVVANMRACPQPIVAALNGTVAGAGAALALASDLRIASPEAKISFLFVRAGLSGADMAAGWLLPRLVGLGRATELLMLGDTISAEEAQRIGLYNHVVPANKLQEVARALANRLADGPSKGIAVTKETLDRQLSMSLAEALEWDARVQAECMQHPDFREAYDAFVGKRKPKFT